MKTRFILYILLLMPCINLFAQHFNNPVIAGDCADPTIIRVGKTYYASGTSSEWAPHYPIFKSTDLINWDYLGPAFKTNPEWTKSSFWAPELFDLNGKIYLYYTARRASDGVSYIGVATTNNIEKGFTDHGCLVEFGREAIDAFVFEDEGKLYISWKAYGLDQRPIELLCSELSADGLQLVGEPFTLLKQINNGIEGHYMFKENGYYYILYSIRGCCGANSDYAVSVARSQSFKGPYEHYSMNPILQGDGIDVLSGGHGTAVKTPEGKRYYLYHAYLKGDGFYNGRQSFLKELKINSDNWPVFVTGNLISIKEPMPAVKIKQKPVPNFHDNFKGKTIKPEWTWNFTFSDVDATVKNNQLYLTGKSKDDNKYGTALCVRTLRPNYEVITEVKDQQNTASGLTLYGDKDNLIIFGKECGELVLKQIRRGEERVLYNSPIKGNVTLKIVVSNGNVVSYSFSIDNKNWTMLPENLQKQNVSYLPPWDRAFRPGLIHAGNENIPAEYKYFKLTYK